MFTPSPQSQDQPGCLGGAPRWSTKWDKEAGRGSGLPGHRMATVKVIWSHCVLTGYWPGRYRGSLAVTGHFWTLTQGGSLKISNSPGTGPNHGDLLTQSPLYFYSQVLFGGGGGGVRGKRGRACMDTGIFFFSFK